MITVTVAHDEIFGPLTADPIDGVRLVRWDMVSPLPDGVGAAEIDVVVVPHYFVDPVGFERLADLPNLSVVQLPSAGFEYAVDHVPSNVTLCNGRGVHDAGTAELAVGLLLAMQRGIVLRQGRRCGGGAESNRFSRARARELFSQLARSAAEAGN